MMYLSNRFISWACLFGAIICLFRPVASFSPSTALSPRTAALSSLHHAATKKITRTPVQSVRLYASNDEEVSINESDQGILGVVGCMAALITLYSEWTLKQTGCGLPAGPLGLVGLVEGLSYLGVVGIVGFSLYTKVKSGSGLPSGPAGLLGAAEGLSFLAALVGVVVLVLQVTNYGYIPNAVPMEGGMCS